MTALTTRIADWCRTAKPGDRMTYHKGNLANDIDPGFSILPEPERKAAGRIASEALALAEVGRVHLVQQRTRGGFRYIAELASPEFQRRSQR